MRVPDAAHVAALFDNDETLVRDVAAFVAEGLADGERVIVIATAAHRRAITSRLTGLTHDSAAQYVVVDADLMLREITSNGVVNPDRFASMLGTLLRDDGRCRVYGELVSLLVDRGDLDAAIAIETLGQQLVSERHVAVLCGYHVKRNLDLTAAALARIDAAHDQIVDTRAPLVLLAADDEDALHTYGEYLRGSGYRVVVARDCAEAVRLAHAHQPDLVVMDVRIPGLAAADAPRELRTHPALEQMPILALTAAAPDTERAAMLAGGFAAVIAKPCLPDHLARVIRTTLARVAT